MPILEERCELGVLAANRRANVFARQGCRGQCREIVRCVVFESEALKSIKGFSTDD